MSQTSIFFQDGKSLYFADESDILTVGSTDLATPISVKVTVGSEDLAVFTMDTYNGLAVIPVGEILRSSGKRNNSEGSSIKISVSQGDASNSLTARCLFCRRLSDAASELFANWLTCGPDSRSTYVDAAESLPFITDPDAISQRAMIQIVFKDGSVQTRPFMDLKGMTGDGLDVSHTSIQAFARSLMLYSEIESYSLWIEHIDQEGSSTTGHAVKFNVSRDRLERITYKFVNPKGSFEYIHASGDLKRSIESETGTFLTSGVETELSNDSTKTMEQNSGHIGGAAEAEFWLGFLASRERYVREPDGSERLIVVDDSSPSVTDLKVGDLTFRWHYGNKNNTIINKISIPVESLEITGDSSVDNDQNQAQLGIIYNPAATTQRGVVWQLIDGAAYASLSATGLLTVKKGAQGNPVTIKAVSSHNGDIQTTKTVMVTFHDEPSAAYGLTVTTNVDSPTISLKIDGSIVEYFDGILIREGQSISISISKSGYTTVSKTFSFSYGEKDQHFELSEVIWASYSAPTTISSAAQNVPIVISDPQNHGWRIDADMAMYYNRVTGLGVTSGDAEVSYHLISGTGDAVVYLTIKACTDLYGHAISDGDATIYFTDMEKGVGDSEFIYLYQNGTREDMTLVTEVTLDKSSLSLSKGGSATLKATVTPSNATNKDVNWTSSNPSVATVSQSGKVTALAPGETVIRAAATDGSGKGATCVVNVTTSTTPVTGVSLSKSRLVVDKGGTATLTANVTPSNATNKAVTWSSSNESVATVNSSGVVTGIGVGQATITVTTSDGGKTATCLVTVDEPADSPGSISVNDITAAASATSAAAVINTDKMDISSLSVSTNSSWITSCQVDRSTSVPRVRLNFSGNASTIARTAIITLTGTDSSGNTITTTFTITQQGSSSSDVPCETMEIDGVEGISINSNAAEYSVTFAPSATTQKGCVWTLTSQTGDDVSDRVSLEVNGLKCVVRIIDSSVRNLYLTLTARNSYNSAVYATKTIVASYVLPPDAIQVSPGYVSVEADSVSDTTPILTLADWIDESDLEVVTSGFIEHAGVSKALHILARFTANTGTSARNGSVVVSYTDPDTLETVSVVVYYTQKRGQSQEVGLSVAALNIEQVGNNISAMFQVIFRNQQSEEFTFKGLSYTITGYNEDQEETFTKSGVLDEKTVASLSSEIDMFGVVWAGSLGDTKNYKVTVRNGTQMSDTHYSDGNDDIL